MSVQKIKLEVCPIGTRIWVDDIEQCGVVEFKLTQTVRRVPVLTLKSIALNSSIEGAAKVINIEVCAHCKGKLKQRELVDVKPLDSDSVHRFPAVEHGARNRPPRAQSKKSRKSR